MRGAYQPASFPGDLDEGAVLRELESLEGSSGWLPLSTTQLRKFCQLLRMPTLELESIVRCIECDPLLAISVVRLVADEVADVEPVRISDCVVIAGRDRLFSLAKIENRACANLPAIQEFAERSRLFSAIASRLAATTRTVDPAAARLGGLLHAIGEIPVLLSRGGRDCYPMETVAGWGKRLALSWHLPSALVRAVTAYDMQVCNDTSDPMQLIIGATRQLVNSQRTEPAALTAWLSGAQSDATGWHGSS
jgi:HD-like signal output (HDOD) protein